MTTPKKAIVNVGLARCGTTSTDKLFSEVFSDFATPKDTKELKFFLADDPIDTYFGNFSIREDQISFESSPPYCHKGISSFKNVMSKILQLKDMGVEVHILFNVRNLLSRAFSHYWHDIDSHYAAFGKLWSVSEPKHPRRFEHLYNSSFFMEINKASDVKFIPQIGKLIYHAIEVAGVNHVHIAFTKDLTACIRDFLYRIDAESRLIDFEVPRTIGALEPIFARTDANGRFIDGNDVPVLRNMRGPKRSAILVSRRRSEILSADDYDLDSIKAATANWTRRIATEEVLQHTYPRLEQETKDIGNLPDICFLAGCKAALLKDLQTYPKSLEVKKRSLSEEELNALMVARK